MNYFSQNMQNGSTPFVKTGVIPSHAVDISSAAFAARDRDPLRIALSTVGDAIKEKKDETEKDASNVIGIFSKLFGA